MFDKWWYVNRGASCTDRDKMEIILCTQIRGVSEIVNIIGDS
jgi:hypothetical protein